MTERRPLEQLISTDEPAWPLVRSWIERARNQAEALPIIDRNTASAALVATQVTTRSPMGAIIFESGGIVVDHGWVRVLGSGHPRLPRSMPAWNRGRADGLWLVGDDAIGGFFALNGGRLSGPIEVMHYFAPDRLEWEPMSDMRFSDWLRWLFDGPLDHFYGDYRWPGWQEETRSLSGDSVIGIYPPLWTREGKDLSRCWRRPVAISEVYSLTVDGSA